MENYDMYKIEELRALLRQRDRQLEGERKGSVRTLEVNEKYREALMQIAHGDTHTAYPHDIAKWALEEGGDW